MSYVAHPETVEVAWRSVAVHSIDDLRVTLVRVVPFHEESRSGDLSVAIRSGEVRFLLATPPPLLLNGSEPTVAEA